MKQVNIGIRVPPERVGVIVGREGVVKARFESAFNVKLVIDGATGDIDIQFDPSAVDRVVVEKIRNILIAIGLGFSPSKAMKLTEDDTYLETIDLHELVGKAPRNLERVKGRIIGKSGKAWKTVEQLTGTLLSIQGRYIAVIGGPEGVEAAKSAVRMFSEGSQHKTVYGYLEKTRRELKRSQMEIWETGQAPKEPISEKEGGAEEGEGDDRGEDEGSEEEGA